MPITNKLLSPPEWQLKSGTGSNSACPAVVVGMQIALSDEVTHTEKDGKRMTYPPNSMGIVRKMYHTTHSTGCILEMSDGRKIPVAAPFLKLSSFPQTLKPYATPTP